MAKLGLILRINKEDLVSKVKVTRILEKLIMSSGSVKQKNARHCQIG